MNTFWMVISCFLMSSLGACVKLAGNHFNLGQTVFMRGFIPVLMLGGWILWHRLSLRSTYWRTHLYRSTVGTLGMLLYFATIARLPLAAAVTLNNTSALFMAAILTLRSRRHPPLPVLLALGLGFGGVAMVLQPTISQDQWLGGLLGLGSGLLACIAQLNLRELGRVGEPEWRTVFIFSATCTLLALPLGLTLPSNVTHATTTQWSFLFAVGVFGCLGQLALTRAYSSGRTIVTASLSYTTVIFSSLYGVALWGDRLSLLSWLGIATIVIASLISTHPAVWANHVMERGNEA
jgi:S-adenosylmethionine uptake transporter